MTTVTLLDRTTLPRKPAWIRVKAPTSRGLSRHAPADAREGPAHGLRGGGLPEHRRVLGAEARDGDDPGRHLHPRLRLLQRQDRDAARGRPAASRRTWPRSWPTMGLAHVVITSVDRDDLPDGGAFQFVRCIEAIRRSAPGTTIEILTPDFLRKPGAVEAIVAARPDVYNHNLETVPRLYRTVRPGCALLPLAAPAAAGQGAGPDAVHQVRHHGRAWARRSARSCRSWTTCARPTSTSSPSASTCSRRRATTRSSASSSPPSSRATPARRAPRASSWSRPRR